MTDDRLRELDAHLEATEELPIRREANRWIAEAHALTSDLAESDLPDEVVERRVGEVVELLSEVGETGSPEADERVAAALDIARELL